MSAKPLLAVDVDGVISLFGGEAMPPAEAPLQLIEGVMHRISRPAGEHLRNLAGHYDLVWATGWEGRANDHLPHLLGLPSELPFVSFEHSSRFGSAHWKLGPLEELARGRALAWIDDALDESCHEWAARRAEPTLLVPTSSKRGLGDEEAATLLAWARSLAARRDA